MSYTQRTAAHCDLCGHEWLFTDTPKRCAKCKARGWDTSPDAVVSKVNVRTKTITVDFLPPATLPVQRVSSLRPAHDPKSCRVYKCGLCASK